MVEDRMYDRGKAVVGHTMMIYKCEISGCVKFTFYIQALDSAISDIREQT